MRLLTSLDKLSELADKGDDGALKAMLDTIANEYNLLAKKYPQDIELFNHVQSKCLVYLDMLKRKKEQAVSNKPRKETKAVVKKNIAAVIKKRNELGNELPVSNAGADAANLGAGAKQKAEPPKT